MKSICVFCGSSFGCQPAYEKAAQALGREIADRDLTLIYGGGNVGLMGAVADAALSAGGSVIGVIPQFLVDKELAHTELTQLEIVQSMHDRKARMAALADGFVALPGGYGTIEEFSEVLTWAQLGLHQKPHGLLNIEGYYDALLKFFDRAMNDQLLRPTHRSLIIEATEPRELLDQFAIYKPQFVAKWIESESQT